MRSKIISIGLILAFAIVAIISNTAPDSKLAKPEQKLIENTAYVTDQAQAFSFYKKIYSQEQAKHKQKALSIWGIPEMSTKQKWVSYSEDYQQKTSIDYEKGLIKVSQIVDKSDQSAKQLINKRLKNLQTLTFRQAYQEDQVATSVDEILTKSISPELMKVAEPPDTRMDVLPADKTPQGRIEKHAVKNSQKTEITIFIKIPKEKLHTRARKFLSSVEIHAVKKEIPVSLIFAIMENESSFNPMAKSHIPAYGLLQVVPNTAGRDATKHLFGRQKLLSASYLYTPEKNINIGTAYMHLLYYRYFRKVENPQSRLYCTIAAYNTGAGNVAKSFVGSSNIAKASVQVNKMKADEVYAHLLKNLPYAETKNYLKKVYKSYQQYQKLKI